MNKCTEGWPNAPGDVSPDAYEAFLAHVARCPFHQKALDAEEEKIRSKIRLARGLDPHGRILRGRDLQRTVATYDRNHALWRQAAKETPRPFKRIYLSNHGEDIAGSGKFWDFRKYEGYHHLDPEAGLQIWGVLGEGKSIPNVMLASCPLKGVEHTGKEKFWRLENGYTVGLRVEQLSEREFNIGFRCVENEVLERERTEAAGSVNCGTSLPSRLVTETLQWAHLSWRWTVAQLRSLYKAIQPEPLNFQDKLVLCAISAMVVFSLNLTVTLWQGPRAEAKSSSDTESTKISSSKNAKPTKAPRKQSQQISGQTSVKANKADKRSPGTQTPETKQDVGSDNGAANDKASSTETKSDANAEDVNMPVVWLFQSEPPSAVTTDGVVVHSAFDPALANKLTVEMRKRHFSIRPFNSSSLPANHVAVSWTMFREDAAVTVEATLTEGRDSKVLSFRTSGTCPEQVCDDAVRTAVSGVIAVMRDLTQSE